MAISKFLSSWVLFTGKITFFHTPSRIDSSNRLVICSLSLDDNLFSTISIPRAFKLSPSSSRQDNNGFITPFFCGTFRRVPKLKPEIFMSRDGKRTLRAQQSASNSNPIATCRTESRTYLKPDDHTLAFSDLFPWSHSNYPHCLYKRLLMSS